MKKFIKFALVSVVVAFAGFGIYQNMPQENTLSDFALENIEALTDDETLRKDCDKNGCYLYYGGHCYYNVSTSNPKYCPNSSSWPII